MKVENTGEGKATGSCTNDCDRVSQIALLYAVSMVALTAAICLMGSPGSCFSETLAEPQEMRGWRVLDSLRFIAASRLSFFATVTRLHRLNGAKQGPHVWSKSKSR